MVAGAAARLALLLVAVGCTAAVRPPTAHGMSERTGLGAPELHTLHPAPSAWSKWLRHALWGGGASAGDGGAGAAAAPDPPPPGSECEGGEIRRNGLKVLKEMPFIGLFEDLRNMSKFEASGMSSGKGSLWVVFDNLHSIGRVDEHFEFRDPHNALIGQLGEDSQFEGLTYDEHTGHFYVVQEVVEFGDSHLHPVALEIAVDERAKTYRIVERCPIHYRLSHENKGFEGLHFYRDPANPDREFLMGLCEGNFCKGGSRGRQRGNGRMVVSEYRKAPDGSCSWEVVKVVRLPQSANFQDYSGMDFRGSKAAITSQEDSAVWIGDFDFAALDFVDGPGDTVYHFPRDSHCDMIYCNVEGISWLDNARFIVSSDKAKSYQPYRCTRHDQSIAIVALPP